MSDAFGEASLRCLCLMFSDQPVPLDGAGFNIYLNTKFFKSVHLFSDIKIGHSYVSGIPPGVPFKFLQSIDTVIG